MTDRPRPTQGQMILVAKDLESFRRAISEMEFGRRAHIRAIFGVESPDSSLAVMGSLVGVLGTYLHDVVKPDLPAAEYNEIVQHALLNIYAQAHGVHPSQVNAQFVVRGEEGAA